MRRQPLSGLCYTPQGFTIFSASALEFLLPPSLLHRNQIWSSESRAGDRSERQRAGWTLTPPPIACNYGFNLLRFTWPHSCSGLAIAHVQIDIIHSPDMSEAHLNSGRAPCYRQHIELCILVLRLSKELVSVPPKALRKSRHPLQWSHLVLVEWEKLSSQPNTKTSYRSAKISSSSNKMTVGKFSKVCAVFNKFLIC